MKKITKIILISITLLMIIVLPVMADGMEENVTVPEKKAHFMISYGLNFVENTYGFAGEFGRWEVGGSVLTGFPLKFLTSAGKWSEKGVLTCLENSFTTAYGVGLHGRFDVIKSERHDLDIGIAIKVNSANMFNNYRRLSANLNATMRYKYNFKSGVGLFLETEFPIVNWQKDQNNPEDKGSWATFKFDTDSFDDALLLGGLIYTRLGISYSF